MTTETYQTITQTVLQSDPTTCVGCVAHRVGGHMCRELRTDGTCQKVLAHRAHVISVVATLGNQAMACHKEQEIGPLIKALLDGHVPTLTG